jgi:hypothetical protein
MAAERIRLAMRIPAFPVAMVCACALRAHPLAAQTTPADVPANHWAAAYVKAVMDRGVMDAPGGRFDGGRKVTRIELANTLARYARALEKGAWQGSAPTAAKAKQPSAKAWESSGVTRFELAALLDRSGRDIAQGLPKAAGKTFGASEALPAASMAKVPKSSPAYESVAYLAKNHMVWGDSVLLNPTSAPVSGKDVVTSVTMLVAGLNDRLTDEPQNREDLGLPPSHQNK